MKQKWQNSKSCFFFQSNHTFHSNDKNPESAHYLEGNQDHDGDQLWLKGNSFLKNCDIFNAIKCYKCCIEADPMNEDEIIGLGCLQDRIGYHYEQQYKWVEKMMAEKSKSGSAYDMLSVCLSKYGNYQEEKGWYEKMIKKQRNYKLLYGLANLQYNNKKFDKALKLYKQSIEMRSDWDQPYQKIANIYCFKLNEDDESVKWAEKALKLDPNNIFAVLIEALCTKQIDERIIKLKNIIQIQQNYARPYNGLGNAYYNLNEYEKAISMYKKSIEVNSKYEHPYYGLGSIHNQLSNFQESIYWYKKCIQLNPLYDYPHYGLGIAYNNKNDIKNAIFWLQKCIQINPKYDCPYYALGNVYRTSRDYAKAIKCYRKSLDCKPIDSLCFVNISLCLISSNEFEKAYGFMMKAKENMEDDKGLSQGNIEYIKEQVNKYLNEQNVNSLNLKGIITFKQKISILQTAAAASAKYRELFQL